jgi:hypothetical protein
MNFRFAFSFLAAAFSLNVVHAATITSFSPAYGSAGETIMIQGSGFVFSPQTNIVRFAGAAGTFYSPYTFAGANTILQAKVPATAPIGSVLRIAVAHSMGGPFVESPIDFKVISSGPYVASLNPISGDAGTLVTISGAHFVIGGGSITVRFNGVVAPVTFDTTTADTQLKYRAPAGVTTGPVTVTRTGAPTNISTAIFYVTPAVTNFSPSVGRAGTNVVIRGRNFTDATGVFFNGLSAQFITNSPTQITATVPPGATTGRIHVQAPAAGYFASTTNFVVQPLITSFTPDKGRPGTNVTIFGENLLGATGVSFGGVPAAAPTGVSYGQLTAVVPNAAPTGPITVQTTNGSFTSSQLFYLPTRIDSITPTNGPVGSVVQIIGTNFLGTSAVTFNGTPAANFWVTNNGSLGAEVPVGVVSGPITVTTPFGTTNSGSRLFYAVPIITGFNPDHGLPGTNVLILGTNFAGVTMVKFNGTNAAFTQANGILTAVVPPNAVTGPVSVTGPAGTTTSAAVFTLDYNSDIAVTATAPASVLLGNDFTYLITITNRGPFAAPNVVLTNHLPGAVSIKSVSGLGNVLINGNRVSGTLGQIATSGTVTVTITVTPVTTGLLVNEATVASGFPDPMPANNTHTLNTTIYVVPALSIQNPTSNQVRLSWSVNLQDYVLQSSTNIVSSNSWSNVQTLPDFVGDQKVVTETIGAGPRFYRLKR